MSRRQVVPPNKALQRTAATVDGLPGHAVAVVAAAAELGRSTKEVPFVQLIEVNGCVYDAEQLMLARGYESLDEIGREAFINHRHLSGEGREAAAERLIRSWATELRAGWPGREFRIYRHSDACEVTIRFHAVRSGVPNWCEDDVQVILVGGPVAERGAAADRGNGD